MIGKWIAYEGIMFHQYVVREVVGETEKFIVVQAYRPDGTCDEIETRRRKKSSIGRHKLFDEKDAADEFASALNSDLRQEATRHDDAIKDIRAKYFGDRHD